MHIKSINISDIKTVEHDGKTVETGIFKNSVGDCSVRLHETGIDGDKQADLRFHGGIDKAVYAYPFEHYSFWQSQLNRQDFDMGQFGENFTTEGLLEKTVFIGDKFRIGNALIEVSQPRQPCFKLGIKMGDPLFPQIFNLSCKTGIYFRVIESGECRAGDRFELIEQHKTLISVHDINRIMFIDKDDPLIETAAYLEPLTVEWQEILRKRLSNNS